MPRPLPPLLLLLLLASGCQPDSGSQPPSPAAETAETNTGSETPAARNGNPQATFPAQQRAQADPARVAQGEAIYSVNCRVCHGPDLRGGDMGGPNLLRSDIVLNDERGELIGEVVREGRNNPGMTQMPALPLEDNEVEAVAAYIHSVLATARPQGAPPPGSEQRLDIVTGDAAAGEQHFAALCSSCHATDGDLAGVASRIPDPEELQNSWVAGRTWGEPVDNSDPRRAARVTVELENGDRVSGRLKRRDDFIVSLQTDTGEHRSFRLRGASPAVSALSVEDPMARHLELMGELDDDTMHDITAYLVTLK